MKSTQNFPLIVLLLTLAVFGTSGNAEPQVEVLVLEVDGVVGPATSDYIGRSLERASERQAELVILRMDTPGGLDTSMRSIIKRILSSSVPVALFVAPAGARAASAGTYIAYASHVAAMAPGTNLGAATPVQLGGLPQIEEDPDKAEKGDEASDTKGAPAGDAKTRKLVNDAAAYIRGLAQLRGRNGDWAEIAVRQGDSLPAEEALEKGVIDLVAEDISDLLRQLHGREVSVLGETRVLNTAGAALTYLQPDWRNRLLAIISNPNVAYVLMLLGIYGLIYEFSNPGALVPGVVGAICLVLAFYAFHVLPVNYAGFALILLGLALMVGEAFAPSFGALGIGGLIAFVFGSIILIDADAPGYGISLPLILSLALVTGATMLLVLTMALRSRRRPVVSGGEQLIGSTGQVVAGFQGEGSILVHGEVWRARSNQSLATGQRVRVTGREGLILEISPIHKEEN